MKIFGTLYVYELKKLLKRPLSWVMVVLIAGLCVNVGTSRGVGYPGISVPVWDENGHETEEWQHVSGWEMYDAYAKTAGKLDGRAMDDAFFQEVLDNVPDREWYAEDLYFWTEDATYYEPYCMIRGLFWAEGSREPQRVTAEEFHAAQWKEIQASWERNELSQEERDYWTEQMSYIPKPYTYKDHWIGTNSLFNCSYTFFIFLPVVAAVCLCPLFAEDRRRRVEPLVFSTKRSRMPLYLAKLLAGLSTAALAAVIIIGSVAAAMVFLWGGEGFDACVQMYEMLSPRPITVGQAILFSLIMSVLFTLLYGGLTMLISCLTHSALTALAGPVMLAFILGIVQVPKKMGWLKSLWRDNLMGYGGLENLHLMKIFGLSLNNFQYGPLLYLGITVILLALCWPGWRRSAIGRK